MPVTTTAVAESAPIRGSRPASATSAGRHADPADPAQQERGAGQRGQHEAGKEPVRERLGRVAEPEARDPEAERPAERRRAGPPREVRAARCLSAAARGAGRRASTASVLVVLDGDRAHDVVAAVLEHDDVAAVGGLEHLAVRARGRGPRMPPGAGSGTERGRRNGRSRRRGWRSGASGPLRKAPRRPPRCAPRSPGRRRRTARPAAAPAASWVSARASSTRRR